MIFYFRVDAKTATTLIKSNESSKAKAVDSDTLRVAVPVTRADILHFCDIAEDCAVAYGFQ